MHPQIQEILDDLEAAQKRLNELARTVPEATWGDRVDPDRWSVSECVEHLNLTTEAFLPRLKAAVDELRPPGVSQGGGMPGRIGNSYRYRRDPAGWFLWKIMPPPVRRIRAKTTAEFVANANLSPRQIRMRFDSLQAELIGLLRSADGLAIDKVKIRSPFGEKLKYNAFAAFGILPRHQHRHIWQAEQLYRSA